MAAPPGHGYIDYDGDDELFWRIETLWKAAANQAVKEVRLDTLDWKEDSCYILGGEPTWEAFAIHCARVMDADMERPIILGPEGDVMDGMHRITRAFVEGRSVLPAVVLDPVPDPDRIRPRDGSGR